MMRGRTYRKETSPWDAKAPRPPDLLVPRAVCAADQCGLSRVDGEHCATSQCGLSNSQKRRMRCRTVALRWEHPGNGLPSFFPEVADPAQREFSSWCYALFGRILRLEQEVGEISRTLTGIINDKHKADTHLAETQAVGGRSGKMDDPPTETKPTERQVCGISYYSQFGDSLVYDQDAEPNVRPSETFGDNSACIAADY